MQYFSLFILFSLSIFSSFAQKQELSGVVKDSETGEKLPGATVFIDSLSKGTLSDIKGRYSITLPMGSHRILFSYIGYSADTQIVRLKKNTILNVQLKSESRTLEEVLVQSEPLKEKLQSSQMSVTTITAKEAKLLPAIFGEVDIFKTFQLKPGVKSGGEGASGLYVRGGGVDQNLILVDNAVVYNPYHLFGFFSIFNSDAIKDAELYKGGFPAQFGGRLSSVIDIKTREGNTEQFSGSGGIGIISSRLTLETPVNQHSSLIVSARRTYFDVFTRLVNRQNKNDPDYDPIPDYYFYDLNGKYAYDLGDRDKLSISGYYGNDVFKFNDDDFNFNFNWGNSMIQTQWQHFFNTDLVAKTSLVYTKYDYQIRNFFDDFEFKIGSQVNDLTGLIDFNYYPDDRNSIKFGLSATRHKFIVGRIKGGDSEGETSFDAGNDYKGTEWGAYISDDFKLSKAITLNGGLRLSGFINQTNYFYGLEPRISGKFSLNEMVALKASYARMFQYIHLVSSSSATLPTDIWYPSNELVKPQISDQIAAGVSFLSRNKKILITNEAYYKWMDRQIDFKEGAGLFLTSNLDDNFVFGKGYSYGNEVYIEKKQGKTTGWIGYTLSWTWRDFEDINNGKRFFARYDRRHDVSLVVMHQLNKRFSLSGTWVYGTGNAVTLPSGRFVLQEVENIGPKVIPIVENRNGYRMKPYHRMDLSVVYKIYPRWGESDLTFSVYNVYNRYNPYFLYIDEEKADEGGVVTSYQGKQVSLFPIIPTLTYNFKF